MFSIDLNFFLSTLTFALLGLIIGSFLNVVIYRLPIMMQAGSYSSLSKFKIFNLAYPSSHCSHCYHFLKVQHNIPLLSFILLKGKCAFCQSTISWRYPIIEFLSCILSIIGFLVFGWSWQVVAFMIVAWLLLSISAIDIEHHLIPDSLVLLLLWLGLLVNTIPLFCNSTDAIIGAVVGYIFFAVIAVTFKWLAGKEGLGQGDWKLLAALGAWLGWRALPLLILSSALLGIIFGIINLIIYRKSLPLPFAPYLALAGIILIVISKIYPAYLEMLLYA